MYFRGKHDLRLAMGVGEEGEVKITSNAELGVLHT